jgi:glyoxylase-like metal-dependent hydrolase (beta-lactamase superfamily II)
MCFWLCFCLSLEIIKLTLKNMESLTENKKNHKTDYFEVAPGVWGLKIFFVNVYIIQNAATEKWILVDAGLKGSSKIIKEMAEDLFGKDAQPSAIVLTHGHFDHIGALEALLEEWDVPVYAHYLEQPYLNGTSSYPPPDPTVGGGLMSLLSWAFPKTPIDVSDYLYELRDDGSVPFQNEWEFIHTPGHTPGHISLFRSTDRLLIAGDAFVTTQQESAFSVMTQEKKISAPPSYFTPDWPSAYESVHKLRDLEPEIVASGHGKPMSGEALHKGLNHLADNFFDLYVPDTGRYVKESATAGKDGVDYIPPLNTGTIIKTGSVLLLGVVGAFSVINYFRKH